MLVPRSRSVTTNKTSMTATNLLGTLAVTAYISTGHVCSDGKMPRVGITCAASRSIPLGTHVYIEGVGERLVEDRTNKRFDSKTITNSRLDLFVSDRKTALKWGKRKLKVWILKPSITPP